MGESLCTMNSTKTVEDDDMSQLEGKVALVTGAATGIGRASALALAGAGAAVCVSDINSAGVEQTAQRIIDAGGKAIAVTCDVTEAEDVRAMVEASVDGLRPSGRGRQQRGHRRLLHGSPARSR